MHVLARPSHVRPPPTIPVRVEMTRCRRLTLLVGDREWPVDLCPPRAPQWKDGSVDRVGQS